jgi:hypothetical protein
MLVSTIRSAAPADGDQRRQALERGIDRIVGAGLPLPRQGREAEGRARHLLPACRIEPPCLHHFAQHRARAGAREHWIAGG